MKHLLRGVLLKILFPLLMLLSAFMKGKREAFQLWVIRMNNRLVDPHAIPADNVLILLPHCLQIADCEVRITHNIRNCKRCGRCEIRDLIAIAEEHGLELFVATGGRTSSSPWRANVTSAAASSIPIPCRSSAF
jgi:hypothetical protein